MFNEKRSYQYTGVVEDDVPKPPQNAADVTTGVGTNYTIDQLKNFIPPGTQLSTKPPSVQFPPPPSTSGITPYMPRNYNRNPGCISSWTYVSLKTGGPMSSFPFWLITINPAFMFGFVWVLLPTGATFPISIAVPLNILLSLSCPF